MMVSLSSFMIFSELQNHLACIFYRSFKDYDFRALINPANSYQVFSCAVTFFALNRVYK